MWVPPQVLNRDSPSKTLYFSNDLRILAMYEAKKKPSKSCNFWTFWPVIQPINHLSKSFRWIFSTLKTLLGSKAHC